MTQRGAAEGQSGGERAAVGYGFGRAVRSADPLPAADDPLRSVSIALSVLECFLGAGEMGASAVAREIGIAKSTASRMLAALAAHNLLERNEKGRYSLGLRTFEFGQLFVHRLNLHAAAVPVLVALRERLGQTVQLGVPIGADVLFIDRFEHGTGPLGERFHGGPWRRVPAHSSSSGRAIAAHNPVVARVVLSAGLQRHTPRTVTNPQRFREILLETRRRGWTATEEEFELGLASVAAPVVVTRGGQPQAVAAVSVAGPTQHIAGQRVAVTARHVQAAARRVSAALASPAA